MRCIHCGSSAGDYRKQELSTKEWNDLCTDVSSLGCQLITFLGGEPFIRRDWFDIATHVKDLGMNVSIITNGFLINEKLIDQLRKIDPYTIAISIDGATDVTHDTIRNHPGSLEKCKQAFDQLNKVNIPTTAVTTVHKMNLKELPQLREYLLNRNIAWQIQIADTMGRFPKELHLSPKEFYSVGLFIASSRSKYSFDELPITGAHCIGYNSKVLPPTQMSPKWTGCQAGTAALAIQSDGGIKGCLSLSDEYKEGSIKNHSIINIWNDTTTFSYNRQFLKEDLKGDCYNCKYGKSCKGGCLGVSIAETGDLHHDPYCFYLFEKQNL
ncbi:MAG: radical SAM protein [Candidatus Thermoplasmatota archaeon]|nr:radical SAM protein [Candidatus Thermoplasmatota archaeon]MBU1941782.1 radical SAM protein [Candidatus Thermoplasmatota archaeon]